MPESGEHRVLELEQETRVTGPVADSPSGTDAACEALQGDVRAGRLVVNCVNDAHAAARDFLLDAVSSRDPAEARVLRGCGFSGRHSNIVPLFSPSGCPVPR